MVVVNHKLLTVFPWRVTFYTLVLYIVGWNLIMTKSHVAHSQEFLTPEKCAQHIIVRGLVRVLMVSEVGRILYFLSKQGFVNHGILSDVPRSLGTPKDSKVKVLHSLQSHSCRRPALGMARA